jgi:hypothetical protein
MGIEAGIPLMDKPMDPLCKEHAELLLEPLQHFNLDIFIWHFLEAARHMEITV